MTLSVIHTEASAGRRLDRCRRVCVGVYALLLTSSSRLLNDPHELWQITGRQWIIDDRAVREADVHSLTIRGTPWTGRPFPRQLIQTRPVSSDVARHLGACKSTAARLSWLPSVRQQA